MIPNLKKSEQKSIKAANKKRNRKLKIMNLKQIIVYFCAFMAWLFMMMYLAFGLVSVFNKGKKIPKDETKKKNTNNKYPVWQIEGFGSERVLEQVLSAFTVLCFLSILFYVLWESNYWVFHSNRTILWLLICILGSSCGIYSLGFISSLDAAERQQPKTTEIKDTLPSHKCNVGKKYFFLSAVILFFPWFIAYRFGKWTGKKKYEKIAE